MTESIAVNRSGESRSTRLIRWIPWLVLLAAAVHVCVGVVASFPEWQGILADGLWDTVANDDDARMTALWFMVSGIAFFGIGFLSRRMLSISGRTSTEIGWIMLATGIPVSVMEPISGGWLLIVIGVLAVAAARRERR